MRIMTDSITKSQITVKAGQLSNKGNCSQYFMNDISLLNSVKYELHVLRGLLAVETYELVGKNQAINIL